jgi:NADH dehydrogenase
MPDIYVPKSDLPRLVVVGGGFAGINVIRRLRDGPFHLVLVDQNNFHQFQPLFYQVATCGLEPDAIIFPLRKLFDGYPRFTFRMAGVQRVDPEAKTIVTDRGRLTYDRLVLATGSVTNFFGSAPLEQSTVGMKTIREALDIRSLILQNLEAAAITGDPHERDALTNIVVVGGGPAGVETAGALAEFKRYILVKDYPDFDLDMMKIYLIEGGPCLLPAMSKEASAEAERTLRGMGVEIQFCSVVTDFDGALLRTKDGKVLAARAVIWTAGVRGAPPAGLENAPRGPGGRLRVDPYLRVQGLSEVYAVGDIACVMDGEKPAGYPMVAQTAIQQGSRLAENFLAEARGSPLQPFRYFDKGSLATIGKRRAVADVGGWRGRGLSAWIIWCLVHIYFLIGFRNRLLVFLNWVMSYLTYEKGNRFIIRQFKGNVSGAPPAGQEGRAAEVVVQG